MFNTTSKSLSDKMRLFYDSLTDDELESLMIWLYGLNMHCVMFEWIIINRPKLAAKLFEDALRGELNAPNT